MISVFGILWPYLRRHRKALIIAGSAMIGEVLAELAAPWPLKILFDSVLFTHPRGGSPRLSSSLGGHAVTLLIVVAIAAVLLAVLDGVFTYFDDWTTDVVGQEAIYELRQDLFAHLQRLTISFHQDRDTRVGDLLARLSGDIQSLQDLAGSGISTIVTSGLLILTMVGLMYWLDWRLTTLVVILTIPAYLLARKTMTEVRQAMRRARRQEGRVSAVIQESLTAIKFVQAFGLEDHQTRRLDGESRKSLAANLDAAKLQSRLAPLMGILTTASVVAVTVYGVYLVVGRSITPGELLIFISYQRGMQSPIKQLLRFAYTVGNASASVERIGEAFEHEPLHESPGGKDLKPAAGRVLFDNITFGYTQGEPVIRNVTLAADPGQVVAIVGPTGAGKSSLMSLLPRFYDPWEGRVLIDGIDIRDVSLRSLRSQVALVLQDSLIFRTTIRENIAFGCPDASHEEIEAAAEAAGVGVIARQLENGLDTIVSERGTSLSGGQKQCIGLARAILKNAPVVILDEPTSSMDSITERIVLEGFARLASGRTTFVIAHRVATVRNADVVAVLDRGAIVELGPPGTLLGGNTRFAELARTQALAGPAET
jgi:ATP-binding cassette subfamily B protein/subfamily B ATP-binding cassette protein MsbA